MNIKLKKVLLSLLAVSITCLPFMSFSVSVSADTTNSATINVSAKDQVIRGFGASSAWCGAINDSCMDTMYKDVGLDILRVRIDPNEGWNKGDYTKWKDELSNAKKAVARGAIVFATPWTPPASMKTNNAVSGSNNGTLKTSCYADYANYLKTFIKYFKDNGVNLYAISLQNEPDWPADYDGCLWTADQFHDFIKTYGASIASSAKIMMPESLGFNQALSNTTLNDSTTAANVSIIGGHLYGATIKDYPLARTNGKDIWMTEHYYDKPDIGTSMSFAKEINDCMTIGNMNAYVYWWIINNDNGLYTSSGAPLKRAYVIGQFAKFINNGYYRVDATNNPQSNVYISSYIGDNKVVIVAINKGTSQVSQSFNIQNGSTSSVSSWVTSDSLNMAKSSSDISVSNGSFTANLPAQSVTTFVGSLGSTTTMGKTVTLNDGWYYIKNVNAQKYLQVTNNIGKAGQNVELDTGSGVNGQKWYLTNTADGYVTLKSALGNYMLDVANAEDKDGANIQIYNAYSNDAQKYSIKASSTTGANAIATMCSSQTKVLDDYNLQTADGTNVCQWTYTGKDNQLWVFESTTFTHSRVGDVNGDGKVNVSDYLLMKRYIAGSITDFPKIDDDMWAGDINSDGVIDNTDYELLRTHILKGEQSFSKEQASTN